MSKHSENFQFKTNINCGGCVDRVAPVLDQDPGVCHWNVDTAGPDKILSVHSKGITREEVVKKVREAGFEIEDTNA